MRLAFFEIAKYYQQEWTALGARVHIEQLLSGIAGRGHEVWSSYRPDSVPEMKVLPSNRLRRFNLLRSMDAHYVRVDFEQPLPSWWLIEPIRKIFPVMVWEFNCVPEFAQYASRDSEQIRKNIANFKRFARVCDLAICVSEAMAEYVSETLGISQTTVIPNGSDPKLFSPALVCKRHFDPRVLNVVLASGSTLSNQNLALLKKVAGELHDRQSKIVLHTIGPFPADATCLPNIQNHGSVAYADLPNWLAGMDVGLCLYPPGPCDFASPLKVFDYLASGLAVVSTPQLQVKEILSRIDRGTEMIAPTADSFLIADLLERLAGDRSRAKRLGLEGRQLVLDFYNWDRATTDTLRAIETLCSGKGLD